MRYVNHHTNLVPSTNDHRRHWHRSMILYSIIEEQKLVFKSDTRLTGGKE